MRGAPEASWREMNLLAVGYHKREKNPCVVRKSGELNKGKNEKKTDLGEGRGTNTHILGEESPSQASEGGKKDLLRNCPRR